jgi:hypothetical protein
MVTLVIVFRDGCPKFLVTLFSVSNVQRKFTLITFVLCQSYSFVYGKPIELPVISV